MESPVAARASASAEMSDETQISSEADYSPDYPIEEPELAAALDRDLAAPCENAGRESAVATPELESPNYLGLSEDEDAEDEDAEDEDEDAEDEEEEVESNLESQSEPQAVMAPGKEDEHAEFERIFIQWKATNDPRLRERLILMNRSMVMFLARRFMDRGELFEDVMQVGMLGLIYALDGYELDRGVKFSTFAIPTISGEIRRYFRDKVSGMRVPRGLQELHSTLQTRIEELTQQLDRSPTYSEIAFSLKIEVEQVVEAMELGAAIDPLSIDDRFYGEESATIAESVGAPDPQLHAYEEHAALQTALENLGPQERRVLEMSFFEGHSQSEIARRLNVSQMHISRLLRRSLAQLKQLLEES